MKPISFWHRLLDIISPRCCVVCGRRLSISEEVLCARCHLHLPRTDFHLSAYDNEMARLFWHLIPIQRAAALFYFEPHAETANLIYTMKYQYHPEVGEVMGRLTATEFQQAGFFDEIDEIVPIPLARSRQRQRGYNQSMEIARGVSAVTGIPVLDKAVRRLNFKGSQTHKGRWERQENVEEVFELTDPAALQGHHLLLVDDIVTTGATILACARELVKAGDVRISVLALGFAKS